MKVWKPKLNRRGAKRVFTLVEKKSVPKLKQSLKQIYGPLKPKFYSVLGGQILSVASIPIQDGCVHKAVVSKLDRRKNVFEPFADCNLVFGKGAIRITEASKLPKIYKSKRIFIGTDIFGMPLAKNFPVEVESNLFVKQKTGLNLFRLFLNEAISFANKKELKLVAVSAQNKTLVKYYSGFGFKFTKKEGHFRIDLPHS